MSLIITVVVMVILLSIVGYFSLDSVKNSYTANEKKELVALCHILYHHFWFGR